MKKLFLFTALLFIGLPILAQEATKSIKGKVQHLGTSLVNAEVSVSGSEQVIGTDIDGNYKIDAKAGDVLVFSYPSMRTMEIVVEDVTRILNINMITEVNELDEVVVTKTVRKTQKQLFIEYNSNPNLIKTSFGILDKEMAGNSLRILDEKEISKGGMNLADALNGRFAGVFIACNRVTGFLYSQLRSTLTLGGANYDSQSLSNNPGRRSGQPRDLVSYEVDGMLYDELPCNFVDVSNIRRIAVISSLAATTRYGGLASGGLIVINTKTGNFSPGANGIANYDQAKLRNNTFENNALTADETANDVAGYLAALRKSPSEQEAVALYNEQIKAYGNSFFYVLDAYDYFSSRWNSQDFADGIVQQNYRLFKENPAALKSLAYMYQAQDRFEKAHETYKDIFILRPNYAQSYMDLANSYREVGDYQKAASIYARYGYLLEEGFLRNEGKMFTNIIDRELNNLVSLKGREILSRKELKNFILDEEFNGTRLVFEWNDSEAEFELQFVNPENKYFKSEHSLVADAERIKNEKLSGYSSEEYLIDDTIRGTWLVNVKYLGNKSLTPTYIKATIYHNYGSASQRKETKLFKMSLRNANQQWFKVSNAGTIASN